MTAKRLQNITESATIRISNLANELKNQGKDIISFSLGEPDFNTPEHIVDAAKASLDRGETHYTPSPGIPELRRAIAEKLKTDNNIDTKAGNIIVTPGAKQAIFEVMLSVLQEGDEAIIFDPAWVSYDACIKLAGARTVWAPTTRDNGFTPDGPGEYITKKTRLIVMNSPCNPTGGVYGRSAIKEIADLAVDNNIMVLSDEIYEKIIYDKEHISIGVNGQDAGFNHYCQWIFKSICNDRMAPGLCKRAKGSLRTNGQTSFAFRKPGNILCPVCRYCGPSG